MKRGKKKIKVLADMWDGSILILKNKNKKSKVVFKKVNVLNKTNLK